MPVMAEEKQPRSSKKRIREGYNLQVYLPDALGDAIDRFIREHLPRTTKAGLTEAAFVAYLTDRGYWPPPPAPDAAPPG